MHMRRLVCHSLTLIGASLLMVGCIGFPAEAREPVHPVPARNLLVDARSFPADWQVEDCIPYCDQNERFNTAKRSFIPTAYVPGHVKQDVFRFEDGAAAAAKFRRYRDTAFNKKPPPQIPSSDHAPPTAFTYRSPIADESYIACGVDIVPICQAIMRYDNYFIYLFANVTDGQIDGHTIQGNGLDIRDLEPILQAIDAQVSAQLGIPLPTPTP